jgi:hypothetical protein
MLSLFEEDLADDLRDDAAGSLRQSLYDLLRQFTLDEYDALLFADIFGDSDLTNATKLFQDASRLASLMADMRASLFNLLDDLLTEDVAYTPTGNVLVPEQPHQARTVLAKVPAVGPGSSGEVQASLCSNAIGLQLGSGPVQYSVNLTEQSVTGSVGGDGIAVLRFPIDAIARTGSSSCEVNAYNTSSGRFLGGVKVSLGGGSQGGCPVCNEGSSACPAC